MKEILLAYFVALLFATPCRAQLASITGNVKARSTQEGLIGVSIILENTDPLVGTITDPDGRFRLEAGPGSYNITATFVGYKSQTKLL